MVRFGLICFLLSLIMVIQATAQEAEKNPFERRLQSGRDPTGSFRGVADQPSSSQSDHESSRVQAEAPAPYRRLGGHHSSDKSVAGGGVIIGGLVTVIFAAVFSYIRVTRKRDGG